MSDMSINKGLSSKSELASKLFKPKSELINGDGLLKDINSDKFSLLDEVFGDKTVNGEKSDKSWGVDFKLPDFPISDDPRTGGISGTLGRHFPDKDGGIIPPPMNMPDGAKDL